MKTIGLIGGMSWESTTHYYQQLNRCINTRLGGFHSAKIVMVSVDFQPLELHMQRGEWKECEKILAGAAKKLERAGADFFLICTNTMHKVATGVAEAVDIPLLHIADATATHIKEENVHTIGLLGTKFTMEQDFYRSRIEKKFNIKVIIPNDYERQIVHDIIYNELVVGRIIESSKEEFKKIIKNLELNGAEGVVLGCTEIPLLIKQEDCDIPIFDTTTIHAKIAVKMALK